MKILVLDDDDVRHEGFKWKFAKHDVTHVHTVDGAVTALIADGPFDVVFLDHDLNDYGYKSLQKTGAAKVELNGCDVASFIARILEPAKKPKMVVVHSWNPAGASTMMAILRDAKLNAHRWEYRSNFEGVNFA